MTHKIRTSKLSKIIASYLALQLVITTVQPTLVFALTGGPSQPEFNSFTPIGTSDMVNLTSGDFNYNIPIMDVGGYPLNLAYNSGITMDQEASWVGLGWNLNVGQIARSVRGIPDDFNGDELRYENDSQDNVTLGFNLNAKPSLFGGDFPVGFGLGVSYNNINGYTATPSLGVSYDIAGTVDLGVNISSNIETGPTVTPSVGLSSKLKNEKTNTVYKVTNTVGLGLNSRQGIQNLNLSTSVNRVTDVNFKLFGLAYNFQIKENGGLGGGISFNDQHYTPRLRSGLQTDSYTFNVSAAPTIYGAQVQLQGTGYGSYQKIKESEKDKLVPAFGYEFTEHAQDEPLGGVLDVNRENEGTITKNTNLLSVPNYTYDMYSIQGQGIGGSFRPYRGQVGYLYDMEVSNGSNSDTFGAEIGGGNLTYNGYEVKMTDVKAKSKQWKDKNFTIPKFIENKQDNNTIDYESTYFKSYGSLDVDNDSNLFEEEVMGSEPIRLKIEGTKYNRKLSPVFVGEELSGGLVEKEINSKIKRTKRHTRNQSIHNILNKDAEFDAQVVYRNEVLEGETEAFAKPHHAVGMKVMQPDGSTYVYGESVYNTKKIEATFDVSKYRNTANCQDGTVSYNPNILSNRSQHSDGFFNRVTTPAYAHTYLLNGVLSSDYEDLTGNGPTDDDLGAYTKFIYRTHNDNFKWRIPFKENEASFNEGLKSNNRDEKANYVYGEKEIKYIEKIETKTHVAIFKLSNRNDGRGVKGEHGGTAIGNNGTLQKLDKIYLFSKPEYNDLFGLNQLETIPESELMKAAIKVAHFNYKDYTEEGAYQPGAVKDELCLEVPNALNGGGKLTLDKVYFTYRGSYMGKHTPYVFNYADFDGDGVMEANPFYNMKAYDIWGCYKPNDGTSCNINSPLSTSEYPFVEQNRAAADDYTRAWTLSSINLPSGGKMEVQFEADDYQYVQERKALKMFKVSGAGVDAGVAGEIPNGYSIGNFQAPNNIIAKPLYDNDNHYKFLYVNLGQGELTEEDTVTPLGASTFREKYLKGYEDEPIFFRFLLNMKGNTQSLYDYVEGYFLIDQNRISETNVFYDIDTNATYAAIPMEFLDLEGGINGGQNVNPISKAGWYFGRSYLTRLVYGDEEYVNTNNFSAVIESIGTAIGSLGELVSGPNGVLEEKGVAKRFAANKSWIRLLNPNNHKLGGGCRVTSIKLHDNWDKMTDRDGVDAYKQFYGQEYSYNHDDGSSSGVASFEPNSSKENPYVEPFYSKSSNSYKDKINAPRESNYVEKPIGAAFFPSPTITYAKVTVKNLNRETEINGEDVTLKKHATGKVVTEHYTSKDFPTISKFTPLEALKDEPTELSKLFKFSVTNHLTMSQGFVVETNDMNGKIKKQEVYAEDKDSPISGVEYIYSTEEENSSKLNNLLPTIDDSGDVEKQLIGLDYEVVNDFRENRTNTEVGGVNFNVTSFLFAIFPVIVPFPLPTFANHETQLRTATTMKHIHRTGVMVEKKAFDLGSKVSTKSLAWDAETGQVLLTETINEYDDDYYNLTYPVHWYDGYEGMDRAAHNINMEGRFETVSNGYFALQSLTNPSSIIATNHLIEGDEVLLRQVETNFEPDTYWVAGFNGSGHVMLMDRKGKILNECGEEEGPYTFKITRSGYRNQQGASMASVTSMINPINVNNDAELNDLSATTFEYSGGNNNPRIINASAVEYKDFWLPQNEYRLARFYVEDGMINNAEQHANPYLYNVKAEWRALKSYAYLTGRNFNTDLDATGSSPRREGFLNEFNPYYKLSGNSWVKNPLNAEKWTFASEVSQFSPYGAELENADALGRFSSAQYGYNYTLPTAVASNTKYRELGFDGFEDYTYGQRPLTTSGLAFGPINHHFSFADENTIAAGRTQGKSHTGRYSIVVNGENNQVTLSRNLLDTAISPRISCLPPEENEGEPTCNPHETFPRLCPEVATFLISYEIIPGEASIPINFGPDGPSSEGSIVIDDPTENIYGNVTSLDSNQAVEDNVQVSPQQNGFLIALTNLQAGDIYGSRFRIEFILTDINGDATNCRADVIIIPENGCSDSDGPIGGNN